MFPVDSIHRIAAPSAEQRRRQATRPPSHRLVAFFLALLATHASARQEPQSPAPPSAPVTEHAVVLESLDPRYRQWLDSVAGLISDAEREYFLGLRHDFRRDAFIEAFWRIRDPDPRTQVNELRRRFDEYLAASGGLPPIADARGLLYLLNGPPGRWTLPDGRPVSRCFSRSKELEIWFYDGSERVARRFVVVFQQIGRSVPYSAWLPGSPLRPTQRAGLPTREVALLCADELLGYAAAEIGRTHDYEGLLEEVLSPPQPPPEWLDTFAASATDLPQDAETFTAGDEITYPARNQSRTAVQVVVQVPTSEVPGRRFEGALFHDFQLAGEIIRDGDLFESFRYRFEGPTPEAATTIPLGFTRYLRPGPATLRLLIEDVHGGRFAQIVRELDVPSPEGRPNAATPADSSSSAGRPALELQAPSGDVHAGLVRFSARWNGAVEGADALERVVFYLDDKEMLSKRNPPYSVEIDLGATPLPHRVRAVGYAAGREVATDQVWLNQGARRFRVELVEPRPGGIYPGSLTARVAVETPADESVARVEIYVDEERVASLEQEPWAQAVELRGEEPAVVRAVAYLADGSTAEDAVLVNASAFQAAVAVRLVELYPLVLDAAGAPIRDLEKSSFRVLDEGVPRQIERFERAAELPLRAALVVDRSSSMRESLEAVTGAALGFARAVLGSDAAPGATPSPERDRVALISFADQPTVDVEPTAEAVAIERGLAGLTALGGTALWDSAAVALNFFGAEPGPSAVLLFTDGQDENSRLRFEQVRDAARGAGATFYAIAPGSAFAERESRRQLEELAADTGGRVYFLDSLASLESVYSQILADLQSRYLLAFTPPEAEVGAGEGFRELEVEVDRRGAQVLVRRGYSTR